MNNKIFDPNYWNLENTFKQVYNVPVYQRPYSWDYEQVDVLLCDLYNAYKENNHSSYYLGNLIINDKNDKINGNILKFEIIDGQQRITTSVLILLSAFCLAFEKGFESTDESVQNIKKALWKYVDRQYIKDYRTINLNSVESKAFEELYNYCFLANDKNFNIKKFCKSYNKQNKFEERIFNNFLQCYNFLNDKVCFNDKEELLRFTDYLLQNVDFIVILSTANTAKVFSIFESINSKGKKLDEIDLIKTYIFSNLKPSVYDNYLNIWGNLIIKTNDNLYDYIYNFIKAFIVFYRQNISIVNFKAICKKELLEYYKEANISDALEKFLNDLNDKVDYYNLLTNCDKAYSLIPSTKMRAFYKMFTEIGYKHPKPLFLRTFVDYKEEKISKNDAIEIIVGTIKFMIKFLTISSRDSKDVISIFSKIMNNCYEMGKISKDDVCYNLYNELIDKGITNEKLKLDLNSIDSFEQNKKLTISLLSIFESADYNEKGVYKISYDQVFTLINNFSQAFSLDHLLVQSPDIDSNKFSYYRDPITEKLVLKENNDFPKAEVVNGMDYDIFTRRILNKIGNLRIYYKDKNSMRQNSEIILKDNNDFCTYSDIEKRGKDIVNLIIDEILILPSFNISNTYKPKNKNDQNLPKMIDLLNYNFLSSGDEVYLKEVGESSKATVIDSKFVLYKDEKITFTNWGCTVLNWPSINIYNHVVKVGESETLQQKRIRLFKMKEENNG